MARFTEIKEKAQALLPEMTATRRDLHKYAEAGWLEMRTSSLVARQLTDMGYKVLTGEDVCLREARMGVPEEAVLFCVGKVRTRNTGNAKPAHDNTGCT